MRVTLGVAMFLAAASTAPAAQAAATLQTDKPCYTPDEQMMLTGGGYTPGGHVNFVFQLAGKYGSNLLMSRAPAFADASGAISEPFGAPQLASSDDTQEQLFVTANDETRLAPGAPPMPPEETFAAATTMLSAFDVFVTAWEGNRVDPRGKTRIAAYGYEPAKQLWAHYVLRGKRVKTVLIGPLTGPCGDLTKTIRQFPFRPVPAGTYSVYFQGSRLLDKRLGTPYLKVRVTKPAR
jgi:hypothetical protein